jgi:hypothetical protein
MADKKLGNKLYEAIKSDNYETFVELLGTNEDLKRIRATCEFQMTGMLII